MSTPRYARLAATMLARQTETDSSPPAPHERAMAIEAVKRAIEVRARARRASRRTLSLALAAVAVVVVALGVRHFAARRPGPITSMASAPPPAATQAVGIVAHPVGLGASVVVSGTKAPLADGRELAAGSRVVTPPTGRATLTFSTGTRIELGENTDMTVSGDGPTQAFHLEAGSIELYVAKLSSTQRFVVDTPDAEVEVRGTQFRVTIVPADPQCGGGSPTRVAVTEGSVVVRRQGTEERVAAGERWPSACAHPASVTGPVSPRRRAGPPVVLPDPAPAAAAGASASSTLAEQNDLFAEAVAAKRRGDVNVALESFDRFLAKYRASPLAENALVERLRLLRATPGAAANALDTANAYLSRYPNGFARAEAEALVRTVREGGSRSRRSHACGQPLRFTAWQFDADAGSRCAPNGNCRAGLHCDPTSGQCVDCVQDDHCTEPGLRRCDKALHACVECGVDGDCPLGKSCDSTTLECVFSCASGGPCPPDLPRCEPSTLRCVGCLTRSTAATTSPATPSFILASEGSATIERQMATTAAVAGRRERREPSGKRRGATTLAGGSHPG